MQQKYIDGNCKYNKTPKSHVVRWWQKLESLYSLLLMGIWPLDAVAKWLPTGLLRYTKTFLPSHEGTQYIDLEKSSNARVGKI